MKRGCNSWYSSIITLIYLYILWNFIFSHSSLPSLLGIRQQEWGGVVWSGVGLHHPLLNLTHLHLNFGRLFPLWRCTFALITYVSTDWSQQKWGKFTASGQRVVRENLSSGPKCPTFLRCCWKAETSVLWHSSGRTGKRILKDFLSYRISCWWRNQRRLTGGFRPGVVQQ